MPVAGFDARVGEAYEHWAFVPHPLPSEVALSAHTWSLAADVAVSMGRLDWAGRQLPNPALLRRPALRREAQSTSALEGTHAALADVLNLDADDRPDSFPELAEVLNYVRMAEYAYEAIADRPLISSSSK